jgi:hypothetical protein
MTEFTRVKDFAEMGCVLIVSSCRYASGTHEGLLFLEDGREVLRAIELGLEPQDFLPVSWITEDRSALGNDL